RPAARPAEAVPHRQCCRDRRAGTFLDADLPRDGDRADCAPRRLLSGDHQMTQAYAPRTVVMAAMLIVLALVPLYSAWIGSNFALILVTRIVILAIAAVSLNL